MKSFEEQILKVSKEIIIKFIEVGRVSPTTFSEQFDIIYKTIKKTVKEEKQN
jgi:hypothetical protein